MESYKQMYYDKRGPVLVKNLKSRNFDAYYCASAQEALGKALELIPKGASISWGGARSAQQIGLTDAVMNGEYRVIPRGSGTTPEEKAQVQYAWSFSDVFLCGANAISMDGQMVNIDGIGDRVAAISFGPKSVIVIAGMNKVEENLEAAVRRARTVAAPMNMQRFENNTPCAVNAVCADCKSDGCICNQILITRHSRIKDRIRFILVGEDLGF